jgi:hypothetical protein
MSESWGFNLYDCLTARAKRGVLARAEQSKQSRAEQRTCLIYFGKAWSATWKEGARLDWTV